MSEIKKIAVLGAGVMGSGIALTAAQAGFSILLFDLNPEILKQAVQYFESTLEKLVAKAKLSAEEKTRILNLIKTSQDEKEIIADLIIEAIPENLELKQNVFARLEIQNKGKAILASNTSTLPITRIACNLNHPEMAVGMHFFNPAPIMKLVEIIPGAATVETTTQAVIQVAIKMGKQVAIVKDEPGFIVNRVARHYYLESLRLVEENVAGLETIDRLLEATGFKMGAFKLMDLIGVETNHSVTQSLYNSFFQESRFRPSRIQQKKVDAGHFGRKTGRGFYKYD